jgi:hypothetical protein
MPRMAFVIGSDQRRIKLFPSNGEFDGALLGGLAGFSITPLRPDHLTLVPDTLGRGSKREKFGTCCLCRRERIEK